MKVLYAAATAAALTLSVSGIANAVDLRDPNFSDYQINYSTLSVTENGQTRIIDLASGDILYGICKSCTITLDGKSVEASDHDLVEVSGGSLKVHKYPASLEKRSQAPGATNAEIALLLEDAIDESEGYDA